MQFQKPVPQPHYRQGRGIIPGLQLQFSNWDVQRAFAAARMAGIEGRFEEGKEKMLAVHKMEPWNTQIITDIAELCIPLKQYDEGEAWASIALGLDHRTPMAYHWRAWARSWNGFLAGARSDWQDAIRYFRYIPPASAGRKPQFEEELRKICEELAAADPLEHQEAEDRSHLRDDEVADRILSIRAAYERYRERKIRDARATLDAVAQGKDPRDIPSAQEPRARRREAPKAQQSAQSTAAPGQGKRGPQEKRVSFSVDAAGKPSSTPSAEDKGKGKASLSPMETVMAEEEKHLQAVSQAIGAIKAARSSSSRGTVGVQQESGEALNAVLSMSPQFAHDMPAEEAAKILASCGEGSVGGLERFLSQCKADADVSQPDAEPKQDQASGSQQETGVQSADGQSAEPPKPTGGNGKKKKNRKKGGPKAAQEQQLTGRGIMEVPPAPEGPPAAKVPQPPPSLVEPSDDAPASDAATAGSVPESEHSLSPAEQQTQPELEDHMPTKAEPEGVPEGQEESEQAEGVPVDQPEMIAEPEICLEGLHISGRTDSEEEEVYHDAGSGIESPAQLGSQGSRRTSLDSSDNAWPHFSSAGTDSGPQAIDEDSEQGFQEAREAPSAPASDDGEDTGNPDLQCKLQAARDAMRDQDYKAAVKLCKEAEALDPMSLAPLLMKAKANLCQGSVSTCVAIFRRIAERCHELTPGDRLGHFDEAVRAVEQILGDESVGDVTSAKKLITCLKQLKLEGLPEHTAKVVYLESYQRLQEKGAVADLQLFTYSPCDISNQDAAQFLVEVNTLLKQDPEIIDAMAAIAGPSMVAYRRVMSEAAKDLGNRLCKGKRHREALCRYSLACTLDPSNIYALCNRARIHLLLDNPKAAIADTTAVIEAIQGKAAPGDKQLKDLLYKAIFRRGRAHHDLARAKCKAPPIEALEDLKGLDTKQPEVIALMSEYHGLILQFGGAEEYAALAGLFPSKTCAAPPSKADLAAMGEDFEGLSREEMLRRIEHPRRSPTRKPRDDGKVRGIEPGGTPRLRSPRALHGPPIAPAPRILV